MTRHESREHIFKMLFRRDFFEAEEWKEQAERYLDSLSRQEGEEIADEEKKALLDRALAICEKKQYTGRISEKRKRPRRGLNCK